MSEISKEYAKALFMLAAENNHEERYGKALDFLADIFLENPQYIQFLSHPGISLEERFDALEKAFSGALPTEVLSFVKLLCEKNDIKQFDQCVTEYKNMLSEIKQSSNAKVTSAIELTENEKEALIKKLETISGHSVTLTCCVDESILGGLIVEMDGKMVDASMKGHLKDVKDVMEK